MILFAEPFRLECEMVPELVRALKTGFALERPLSGVVQELVIGRIIPDLVAAEGAIPVAFARAKRLSYLHFHILAAAHQPQGTTASEVANTLHLPHATAEKTIADALRRNLIVEFEGRYQIAPEVRPESVDITAVESKLSRWRQALSQAEKYRQFADRAYVALDGNRVALTDSLQEAFSAAGVGLILQYGRVAVESIPAPRLRSVSPERLLAIHRIARVSSEQ